MKKLWNSKLSLILFAIIFIVACKKNEDAINTTFSNVMAYVSNDSPLIEINYEVERVSFQRVLEAKANPGSEFFDNLAAKPKVSRQIIKFKVNSDGSYYLETTEIEPENPIADAVHNTLPDPTPKVKKTILKGTDMELYDNDDKLIRSSKVEAIDLREFINSINVLKAKTDVNSISDAVSKMQVSKLFGLNSGDMEDNAIANGGNVTHDDTYKFIKMPHSNGADKNIKSNIITIHKEKNLPVANDLVGENGKSIFRTLYKYNSVNPDNPKLESVVNLHFKKSVTGSEVVEETIMKIENMDVKVF
jgi:hypothetical protein